MFNFDRIIKEKELLGKRKSTDVVLYAFGGGMALVLPAVCFYLLEFYTHNPFEEVRPWAQFFNIALFELAAFLLFFITGRLKAAYRFLFAGTMLFGIVNAYVVRFRTNPVVPWDLFSIRTAVNVAGNYDFTPDSRMVIVTALFLAVIVALKPVGFRLGRLKTLFHGWSGLRGVLIFRLIPAAVIVLLFGVFGNMLQQESFQNRYRLYNKLFTPVFMTDVDGLAVTFVMNMAYMSIEKPAGYDAKEAETILSSYAARVTQNQISTSGLSENQSVEGAVGEAEEAGELPNILVVMNESFSDLSVLGEFETNRDYMPYLHHLQQGAENTVTGMLNVSVCGGNTANTEFEFLTGNTMAFLPQGSIPYQQYITGELPSLGQYLKGLGYETAAAHPYHANGWDRDTIYPLLGFTKSIFLDGYQGAEYVRQYVSDKSCVESIIEMYESKAKGKPLFVFNVTMQNHGGYQEIYSNFTPQISAEGIENSSLEQYLSLVELSDQSLEQLISYFSQADEKTVVVFFGDHQPNDTVAAPILALNGMAWNALDEEELKLRYQVPYVIWANYEIGEETGADTSVNYLAAEALARAGVPLSSYQSYLVELKAAYPVISTVRLLDASGNELSVQEEKDGMDTYRKLQYYQMFDLDKE